VARTKAPDPLDELVAEFNAGYGQGGKKSRCVICESEHRDLVDRLFQMGAGVVSVGQFLLDKYGFQVSASPLNRHRQQRHAETYQA